MVLLSPRRGTAQNGWNSARLAASASRRFPIALKRLSADPFDCDEVLVCMALAFAGRRIDQHRLPAAGLGLSQRLFLGAAERQIRYDKAQEPKQRRR